MDVVYPPSVFRLLVCLKSARASVSVCVCVMRGAIEAQRDGTRSVKLLNETTSVWLRARDGETKEAALGHEAKQLSIKTLQFAELGSQTSLAQGQLKLHIIPGM